MGRSRREREGLERSNAVAANPRLQFERKHAPLTRTTHNARSDAAMPWLGARVDRLILVYDDAAALKRGFQFWLTWPRAAGKACRCVPIYLLHAERPELDELFQPPCESSLFVLSLSSNEAFSRANTRRLLKLTKRDCARQRGAHPAVPYGSSPIPMVSAMAALRYSGIPARMLHRRADPLCRGQHRGSVELHVAARSEKARPARKNYNRGGRNASDRARHHAMSIVCDNAPMP